MKKILNILVLTQICLANAQNFSLALSAWMIAFGKVKNVEIGSAQIIKISYRANQMLNVFGQTVTAKIQIMIAANSTANYHARVNTLVPGIIIRA